MIKVLLFQVGTIQYGIGLALVKDIKSAKHIVTGETAEDLCFSHVLDGKEVPLYDLFSIFGGQTVSRGYESEKLIIAELQGRAMGMIVSAVNKVASIESECIKPLSPIFNGPSQTCFSSVLLHDESLILLLAPQGVVKVVEEVIDALNFKDPPGNADAAPSKLIQCEFL